MTSLNLTTVSSLADDIQKELEDNKEFMKTFGSKIVTNETVEITNRMFSLELRNKITNGQDKQKVAKAMRKSIEFLYGSKWGFKQLKKIKQTGIKIEYEGVLLEHIIVDEQINNYRKNRFEEEDDDSGFAITWLVKDWYIGEHHIISKLKIYDEIFKELSSAGIKQKDIPLKRSIENQINYVFDMPDVFEWVKRIAYDMGRSNENVVFSSNQIDEMGWYLKGKLYAKKIMFGRDITDLLFLWNGRCYRYDMKRNMIDDEIEKHMFKPTNHTRSEIEGKLIRIADVIEDSEITLFNHIIGLTNGFYNAKTYEFSETVNPDEVLVSKEIPVKYNPEAKCPNLAKYIVNAISEPNQRVGIWEMMAWCLDNGLKMDKAFFLIGVSAENGKSTLLNWIESFIGKWNCGHVAVEDMDNDRFSVSGLVGKTVNLCADLKYGFIKNIKTFGMLVTRDTVRVQHKGEDAFDYEPQCVNIFSTNDPPEFEEKKDSTYRRIYPIDFINKFKKNPTEEELNNGVKKVDFELVDNMFSENEKSGAFNILILCAKKLRVQRMFSFPPLEEEVREYWENMSNHLLDFSRKFLTDCDGAYILGSEMYNTYSNEYCKNRHIPAIGERKFIQQFQVDCEVKTTYTRISKNDRRHCWKNVWWKNKPLPDTLKKQLPLTGDGKPKMNCEECIKGNHGGCTDEKGCLCSNRNHQKK